MHQTILQCESGERFGAALLDALYEAESKRQAMLVETIHGTDFAKPLSRARQAR